jgi:cytochrome c-type biogenesis protein CcmF
MQSNPAYQSNRYGSILSGVTFGFSWNVNVQLKQIGEKLFAFGAFIANRKSYRLGASLIGFGIIVTIVGFVGTAFNKSIQQEIRFRETIKIGQYRLVSQSLTQDNLGKFVSEYVLLDVYRDDGARKVTQLSPEERLYFADQRVAHVTASHSTLQNDLCVSYVGKNPRTGNPIIKVTVKPLAAWKWVGFGIVFLGILVTLVSSVSPSLLQRRA